MGTPFGLPYDDFAKSAYYASQNLTDKLTMRGSHNSHIFRATLLSLGALDPHPDNNEIVSHLTQLWKRSLSWKPARVLIFS